jgi:hypothetical protein
VGVGPRAEHQGRRRRWALRTGRSSAAHILQVRPAAASRPRRSSGAVLSQLGTLGPLASSPVSRNICIACGSISSDRRRPGGWAQHRGRLGGPVWWRGQGGVVSGQRAGALAGGAHLPALLRVGVQLLEGRHLCADLGGHRLGHLAPAAARGPHVRGLQRRGGCRSRRQGPALHKGAALQVQGRRQQRPAEGGLGQLGVVAQGVVAGGVRRGGRPVKSPARSGRGPS